jgi:hypothetical protein
MNRICPSSAGVQELLRPLHLHRVVEDQTTAVHEQCLAGHEARVVAGEVGDRGGLFLRRA